MSRKEDTIGKFEKDLCDLQLVEEAMLEKIDSIREECLSGGNIRERIELLASALLFV